MAVGQQSGAILEAGRANLPARPISNAEKAAILLLAMGRPLAERVMQHLDDSELTIVARYGANLGAVPRTTLEGVVEELSDLMEQSSGLQGSLGRVERLLQGAIPDERFESILADVRGGATQAVWSRLSELPESKLVQFLSKEHPQVAAFIMTKATSTCAAAVLGQLSGELRHQVARRMLSTKRVNDAAIEVLQKVLNEDLVAQSSRMTAPDIHSRMANIINKLDRQRMEEVLNDLADYKPKDTKHIRSLLFTFEDLAKLSVEARSKLVDQVPQDRLILALKGADATLSNLLLSTIGARARRIIEQEIASGAPPPMKEIAKARRAIADLALDLAQRGDIDIGREGADEEA
jgi:flagellar motor switch protein FliG